MNIKIIENVKHVKTGGECNNENDKKIIDLTAGWNSPFSIS